MGPIGFPENPFGRFLKSGRNKQGIEESSNQESSNQDFWKTWAFFGGGVTGIWHP
jgi:hypothetical protein